MDKFDSIFFFAGPILILIGSFFVWFFGKKMIKTNPHIGLFKILAQLSNDYPKDEVIRHDRLYYPHNKRMAILVILGWILIAIGTLLISFAAL